MSTDPLPVIQPGQRWYVTIGGSIVHDVTVREMTEKTIVLEFNNDGSTSFSMLVGLEVPPEYRRYITEKVRFIERVPK